MGKYSFLAATAGFFIACCGAAHQATAALVSLGADDVLVSDGSSLKEYSQSGTLVQTITIPGSGVVSLGVVVSGDGNLQVEANYSGVHHLSTYNFKTSTWSANTASGWGLPGVTYFGAMGADGSAAYVPSYASAGSTSQLIAFPLGNLSSPQSFASGFSAIAVTSGRNGLIYGVTDTGGYDGGFTLEEFNPTTLANVGGVSINHNATVSDVAVWSNGDIYELETSHILYHLSPTGQTIKTLTFPTAQTLAINSKGQIVVGGGSTSVYFTDLNLDPYTTFTVPAGTGAFNDNFVAWTEPAPEPSSLIVLMVAGSGGLLMRQRRKNRA